MIILEGPDGSGKSTLARHLSHVLNLPYHHFGGPPSSKQEIAHRVKFMFDNHDKYVFDRIPLISELVYSQIRSTQESLMNDEEIIEAFGELNSLKPILIYCRAPLSIMMNNQKPKKHDSVQHLEALQKLYRVIVDTYDDIMNDTLMPWAVTYNYNDDPEMSHITTLVLLQLEKRKPPLSSLIQDVSEFQVKVLGNGFPEQPVKLVGNHFMEQYEKLDEELEELNEATLISDQADALIDLIYLSLGTLHQMGVDTQRVWDAVHKANMAKKLGKTKRGHENDAAKPDDWKAPDHTWLDEVK